MDGGHGEMALAAQAGLVRLRYNTLRNGLKRASHDKQNWLDSGPGVRWAIRQGIAASGLFRSPRFSGWVGGIDGNVVVMVAWTGNFRGCIRR